MRPSSSLMVRPARAACVSEWVTITTVVPAFATGLAWRLTPGLPFVNRVAISVAVALVIYGVVYVIAKGLPRF